MSLVLKMILASTLSLRGSANLSMSEFDIEASAIARNRKQRQDTQAGLGETRKDSRMIVSDNRNNARDTLDRIRASGGVHRTLYTIPTYPGPAAWYGLLHLLNCVRLRPLYERPTTVTALRKRNAWLSFPHRRDERGITLFIDVIVD